MEATTTTDTGLETLETIIATLAEAGYQPIDDIEPTAETTDKVLKTIAYMAQDTRYQAVAIDPAGRLTFAAWAEAGTEDCYRLLETTYAGAISAELRTERLDWFLAAATA